MRAGDCRICNWFSYKWSNCYCRNTIRWLYISSVRPGKFKILVGFFFNIKWYPVDIWRKLNLRKMFRRRPGRLLNVLCTFNLRPVSTSNSNVTPVLKYIFFLLEIWPEFRHTWLEWKINSFELMVEAAILSKCVY